MVDDLSGEKAGVFLKENVIGKLIEVTKYVFSLTWNRLKISGPINQVDELAKIKIYPWGKYTCIFQWL